MRAATLTGRKATLPVLLPEHPLSMPVARGCSFLVNSTPRRLGSTIIGGRVLRKSFSVIPGMPTLHLTFVHGTRCNEQKTGMSVPGPDGAFAAGHAAEISRPGNTVAAWPYRLHAHHRQAEVGRSARSGAKATAGVFHFAGRWK